MLSISYFIGSLVMVKRYADVIGISLEYTDETGVLSVYYRNRKVLLTP